MKSLLSSVICVTMFWFVNLGFGQTSGPTSVNDAGYDVHNLYVGDHETISVGSGNLSLNIPLVHLAGRAGNDLTVSLSYNSNFWYLRSVPGYYGSQTWLMEDTGDSHNYQNTLGWTLNQPYIASALINLPGTPPPGQNGNVQCWSDYTIAMPDGRKVMFDYNFFRTGCQKQSSGIMFSDPADNKTTPNSLNDVTFDPVAGTAKLVPSGIGFNGITSSDRNGNQITYSGTGYTDTLGHAVTLSGNTVTYPDENYPPSYVATVSITLGTIDSSGLTLSNFPCAPSGISLMGQSHPSVITSVQYPDGSKYSFWYDQYAELTAVQYPTGGYTRYAYSNICGFSNVFGLNGISVNALGRAATQKFVCRDKQDPFPAAPSSTSCPSGEDETDYAYSFNGVAQYVTITEKSHGQSLVSTSLGMNVGPSSACHFTITDLTTSQVLKTVDRTLKAGVFDGAPVFYCNIGVASETVTREDGVTKSTRTFTYNDPNSWTGPDDIKEYGYDGSLVRETKTTYWPNSIKVLDSPFDVQILNGNGTLMAETAYSYDEYGPYPLVNHSGGSQHDDLNYSTGNLVRGNVTTETHWLLPPNVGTRTALTSHRQYDILGNVVWQQDPNANQTSFDYTDNFGTNVLCPPSRPTFAYVTTTTLPPNSSAFQAKLYNAYYSCSGLAQAKKDDNDVSASRAGTTFSWDVMHRPLCTNYPDGGQTCNSYPDPNTINQTALANPDPSINTTHVLDGLGRTSQTQLASPIGTVTSEVAFDGLGRTLTKTNPHIGTSAQTDGTTQYAYDGLDRATKVTEQDGSTVTTNYYPNSAHTADCITVTDEVGNKRQSCSDALGRLIQVFEDPSNANYETDYQYDVNNNLLSVNQKGGDSNSAHWRARTFTYDSTSRLLCAANPEIGSSTTLAACPASDNGTWVAGTTRYTYDNNGNMLTKQAPKPNQTSNSAAMTMSYAYDALNRLASRSDGTNIDKYYYDQASWASNAIGRLNGFSTNNTDAFDFSYDAMGRINWQAECISHGLNGCATFGPGYNSGGIPGYNLAGQLYSLTYPSGRIVTYQHNSAGWLNKIIYTSYNGTSISPEYDYYAVATGSFLPTGSPTTATFGNGTTETYQYNPRLQPLGLQVAGSIAGTATTFLNRTYSYQQTAWNSYPGPWNAGNVTSVVDNLYNSKHANNSGRDQYFTYDALNRICSASEGLSSQVSGLCSIQNSSQPGRWGFNFTVDPWGNLTNKTLTKGAGTTWNDAPANSNNQLSGYSYDSAGNMLQSGSTPLTYDSLNRITAAGSYQYTYNANSQRNAKINGSDVTNYFYLGDVPVGEFHGSDYSDYIFAGTKRIVKADNFDYLIHVNTNDSNCSPNCSGLWSWVDFPALKDDNNTAVTIQSGDKLVFRQYATTNTVGGIRMIFSDGHGGSPNTNFMNDTNGNPTACDPVAGSWQQRTYDLSSFAGDTTSSFSIILCGSATPGIRDLYFADIAIVHPDGTMVPIYNGQSSLSLNAYPGTGRTTVTQNVYRESTTTIAGNGQAAQNMAYTSWYYHGDHLGTARVMTNGTGYPVWASTFLPFGEEWQQPTPVTTNHYKFTGKERDAETNLDYFGARYFSSGLGRWMSPDWAATPANVPYAILSDPQSLNLYSYVRNKATAAIDVDGHDSLAISFDDYEAEGPLGIHYPYTGHGAVVTIDSKGKTHGYEYGRYDKAQKGIVRELKTGPVVMKNGKPTIASLKRLLSGIAKQEKDYKGSMSAAYYKMSDANTHKVDAYADNRESQNSDPNRPSYNTGIFGKANNCGTFVRDAVGAGGVNTSDASGDIRPTAIVGDLQKDADSSFTYDAGKNELSHKPCRKDGWCLF